MSQSNHKQIPMNNMRENTSQWIENQDYYLVCENTVAKQNDQGFREQHQKYLKSRNKRKEEAIRKKIQEFGQSSSQQEQQKRQTSLNKLFNQKESNNKHKQQEFESTIIHKIQKKQSEVAKSQKKHKYEQKSISNKIEVLINSKKTAEGWNKQQISIQQKSLSISNFNLPLYDLNKFKIFLTTITEGFYKLKINYKNQEIIFAAPYKNKIYQLPTSYYIFSKIIKMKLNVMGKKIASFNDQKSKSSNDSFPKNNYIYGKILKKSRLISRWTQIFAGITTQGLYYHKKLNQKGELLVERGSVSQLWTRFQFQDDFLIIKLFENGHKIELGIPLQDYTSINSWLYHLYSLSNKYI